MTLSCYWGDPISAAPKPRPEMETLSALIRIATRPTMRDIAKTIAERHNLQLEDLTGPDRFHHFVVARQEAFAVSYATGRLSLPQIGRFFGNRDHTTVLHGIRAHRKRVEAAAP